MAQTVPYATRNAVADGFEAQNVRNAAAMKEEQTYQTDRALRGGLRDIYAQPAAAAPPPAPAATPAPAPASVPMPTGGPAAPLTTGEQPAAPMPAARPAAPAMAPPQAPQQPQGPRNPLAGVVANLAGTRGGGAQALNVAMQGERMATQRGVADVRQRQNAERMAMMALGKGDMAVYQHWAGQAGINLPPQVLQDSAMRTRFAAGSLLARRNYRDPQQAQAFIREYVRTGDPMAAINTVGAPRGGAGGGGAGGRGGQWSPLWIQQDNQQVLALLNRRDGTIQIPGQGGAPQAPGGAPGPAAPAPAQPGAAPPAAAPGGGLGAVTAPPPGAAPGGPFVRPPPRTGSAAGPKDREVRMRMLVASGMSEQEAQRIAGGAAPSPGQMLTTFTNLQRAAGQNIDFIGKPADAAKWVDEQMNGLFEEGWRNRVRGGSSAPAQPAPPAPATAPAPAAAPPASAAPAPAAPAAPAAAASPPQRPQTVPPGSAYSPSRRQWRDPAGKIYDETGRPAGA